MFKWKSKKPRQREMQFQKLMENDAYRTLLGGVVGASAGYAMKPQSIKQLMFSSSIQKSQPQSTKPKKKRKFPSFQKLSEVSPAKSAKQLSKTKAVSLTKAKTTSNQTSSLPKQKPSKFKRKSSKSNKKAMLSKIASIIAIKQPAMSKIKFVTSIKKPAKNTPSNQSASLSRNKSSKDKMASKEKLIRKLSRNEQSTKQPARQTTSKNILKKSLDPKYLPKRKEETKRLSINNKIPQPQKGLSKLERLKQWNNGQHEQKVEQPPRKSNINQRLSSLRDKYNDKRSQLIEKYPFIKREKAQVEALKLENEELHERLQRLEEKIDVYKHRKQNNKKRFLLF